MSRQGAPASSSYPSQLTLGFADTTPDCPHGRASRLPKPGPRIISASKRTDIPAAYLDWMIERCDVGWVDVPNPLFHRHPDPLRALTHVSLLPEHVRAIVWWSKSYAVYRSRFRELERYPRQYFHFTINPRREDVRWLEPDVPSLDECLEQLRFLSGLPGGPSMVAWRYDPICFWLEGGEPRSSWDPAFFERMCRELSVIGVTTCYTSLADRYPRYEQRVRRFFPAYRLRDPEPEEIGNLLTAMGECARAYGMRLFSCSERALVREGICEKGACIDGSRFGGTTRDATDRKMRRRGECGCTLHTDVGDYSEHECTFSCVYCYANPSHRRFRVSAAPA